MSAFSRRLREQKAAEQRHWDGVAAQAQAPAAKRGFRLFRRNPHPRGPNLGDVAFANDVGEASAYLALNTIYSALIVPLDGDCLVVCESSEVALEFSRLAEFGWFGGPMSADPILVSRMSPSDTARAISQTFTVRVVDRFVAPYN